MNVSSAVVTDAVGSRALTKAAWRVLPLLFLGYGMAYMDRANVAFAALRMNQDLHFSATIYGLGAGLFFLSYAFCEVPSNLLLVRIGARRWIARIMVTWGLLAAGMMFVRTPAQFYCMRFLLGAAEGGFFPGVLFYLTQWFPRTHRGRIVSRFFISGPVSAAVMGAVSGALLGLQGKLGLAGWQWLFLVEGLPATFLGLVILRYLRDKPADASWLSPAEKAWIEQQLTAEREAAPQAGSGSILSSLTSPLVRRLALCCALVYGSNFSLVLSAPLLLKGVTHWSATKIGLLMSAGYVLAAFGMLVNGQHSDRRCERHLHAVWPMLGFVAACLGMAYWYTSAAAVVPLWVLSAVSAWAMQAVFWLIPSDVIHGRPAAIGFAALGCVGMIGAFIGPYLWGVAKDYTGTFRSGLVALAVAYCIAAAILLLLRHELRARRAEPQDRHLGSHARA